MEEKNPNLKKDVQRFEVKVTDSAFVTVRKNVMLFKDLSEPSIHYSAFYYGSTFDLHSTWEGKNGISKHYQIIKLSIDWEKFFRNFTSDIAANWKTLFRRTRITNPDLKNLHIEFISSQALKELFETFFDKHRLNINEEFIKKLESSLQQSKLSQTPKENFSFGQSSEGDLILIMGQECWILNAKKYFRLVMKNFELSVGEVHIGYYNIGILSWVAKIRLRQLNQMVINRLKAK